MSTEPRLASFHCTPVTTRWTAAFSPNPPLWASWVSMLVIPGPVLGLAHTMGSLQPPGHLGSPAQDFFEKGRACRNSLSPPSEWRNYVSGVKTHTENEPCARVPQGLGLGHLSMVASSPPPRPPPLAFIFLQKKIKSSRFLRGQHVKGT